MQAGKCLVLGRYFNREIAEGAPDRIQTHICFIPESFCF